MYFSDIDKQTIQNKLLADDGEAKLVDIPTNMTRQNEVDKRIRAIEIDGKIVPYLICEDCDSMQIWYKYDSKKASWINQSGVKAMKNHIASCPKSDNGNSLDVKRLLQSHEPSSKRKCLDSKNAKNWKNFVVDQLANNPTVSISAHSRIVSDVANFSASLTHSRGSLFDFSIGRTQLTEHLIKRGKDSQIKLQMIFERAVQRVDFGVAGIIDYWSARHTYLIPYGALVACGLDNNFNWFHFPVRIDPMGNEKKDACHTFEFVRNSVTTDKNKFANPFFICSDNEAKMKAAFDGRFDNPGGFNTDGRVGCVEHALSICVTDVFDKYPHSDLHKFILQISTIETFYNKRPGLAKGLPVSIPEKSTTRPWRSYFHRFNAAVKNYSHYQLSDELEILENLPPMHLCKAALDIMADVNFFLDKLEVNGPTAHLSFLNYLTLDFKLFRKEMGFDNTFSLSKKTAAHLRSVMENKLWTYSGSAFSKAAAFLTGINFRCKIRDLIDSIDMDANSQEKNITSFKQGWLKEANDFDSVVRNEIEMIISSLSEIPDVKSKPMKSIKLGKIQSVDLFDTLFDSSDYPPKTDEIESDMGVLLCAEFKRFELQRRPTLDLQSFWKGADFILLRRAAIILLSVPASSAAIERIFSEAGLILTKLRRHLDPGKLTALVYIKYASKYTELYTSICSTSSSSPERAILDTSMDVLDDTAIEILDDDDDDDDEDDDKLMASCSLP